jgi:leucyl aminopeptidase
VVGGDDLKQNFPLIHTVGRASADAPRLLELRWGKKGHRKITLVGKGVCFDTGGLDIKPASSMLLMKKDMGGAANVMGLALMIMDAKLKVDLRVSSRWSRIRSRRTPSVPATSTRAARA